MNNSKIIKSTTIVIVITIISKIIGFVRDALIANAFGTTYETDAYNMALTIPNMIFGIIGLAIITTFIPILSETYKKKDKKVMFNFANNIINILIVISFITCLVCLLFANYIVKIIAPNFENQTYQLTVILTKISIINILFMAMNSGYTAILQTLNDFTAPALVGIVSNIPIIIYATWGNHSITELTVATILGNSIQVLIQVPWLIKNGYKYKFFINLKDKRINNMLKLIFPVIIGASVNQINSLVDKTIGSGLPAGSISALNLAQRLNGLAFSIFATAIITVMYPKFAQEMSKDNFNRYINKSINAINLVMIPSAIGMIILSKPLIEVIFKRGAFNEESVYMTSIALAFYSIGTMFYGARSIFDRAFYSMKDTKTPMINGVIGMFLNIILNICLVDIMGIGGLALSTSISAITCAVLLVISLKRKIKTLDIKKILKNSNKMFIAAIFMGVIADLVYKNLSYNFNNLISILISVLSAIVVYLGMLFVLKVDEFFEIIEIAKCKFRIIVLKQ